MRTAIGLFLVVGCGAAPARAPANAASAEPPPTMMVGTWVGESDGHRVEESWAVNERDAANGLVGAYRETEGANVVFTEEMTLVPTPTGWRMRIHFFAGGPHLGGKEKQFEFRLAARDGSTLTFENANDDAVRRIVYAIRADDETITLERADGRETMTLRRAR